jgi:hypothetical protein
MGRVYSVGGINWLGLVKGGITGGLSSAVSSTVSNVACYGLAWGLDTIFGLQVGKPGTQKKIEALTTALNNVDAEISAMGQQLSAIIEEIANLNAEINATYHLITNVVLGAAIDTSIAAITATWGSFKGDVAAFAASSGPAPSSAAQTASPPNVAETLASAILAPNDTGIRYQINLITVNLLPLTPGQTLGSDGLLDNWTTILIGYVRQGLPLPKAYGVLEQNFLQILQYLYQAHSLMLNALMYRGAQFSLASVPGNMAAAQSAAQLQGFTYLTETAEPNLKEVSQFFAQCAHRLVLSQYMCLNAGGTDFVPVSEADAQGILARVALIGILVNSQGGPKAPIDPGVVVTGYYRPTQMGTDGSGPSLTPSSAYAAKTGTPFPIEYGYANIWYKVCDFTDSTAMMLRDFAESNIQIANAIWPAPVPAIGQAVGDGVFAQAIAHYYDTTTLDVTTSAGANTVVMAFALDWSSIYDATFCSAPNVFLINSWWSQRIPPGVAPPLLGYKTSVNAQGQFEWIEMASTVGINGAFKQGPITMTSVMYRQMGYGGTTAAALYFRTNWTLTQTVESIASSPKNTPLPWSAAQITVVGPPTPAPVGPALQTIDTTVSVPSASGKQTSSQNWSSEGVVGSCKLEPGGPGSLAYCLDFNTILTAGKQSGGTGGKNQAVSVTAQLKVLPGTTIAWQQPQTGLTTPM